MTNENVFEQMAAEGASAPKEIEQPVSGNGEIDFNAMSDVAVGEKKKYVRSILNGRTVGIKSAQLFNPDTSEEPITSMSNKDVKYWKCTFILTYDTKNADGVDDREYLSGAIAFQQKNGTPSDIKLYRDGAENQVSDLWRLVAKFKGVDPLKLSPKMFMATLNSGIKVKLELKKIKFQGKTHEKNLPVEIVNQ